MSLYLFFFFSLLHITHAGAAAIQNGSLAMIGGDMGGNLW
jgi:hypothetical protein